ncbi:MAG: hypothetical protein KDA86_13845 [Planctomycetaceae bacterium]|nr:hypothetical protein [Planctomycetaceae bacterium]
MTNFLDDDYDPGSGPQPGGSNKALMIGVFAGVGLLVCLLCCGGGIAFFYFGTSVLAEEIRNELKVNPVVQEKVGNIKELEIDWIKSGAADGEDDFVLRIFGDKASGYVTVESITDIDGNEEVVSGTLELDSGETFDLFPEEDSSELPVEPE